MHRATIALLFLAACWTPKETGPRSMIGHLFDAAGDPIEGVRVESVESHWKSEPDGRFAINYKEPQQYVLFEHDELSYSREYRGAIDDGHDIRIQLPETTERTITCYARQPCDAKLTWTLDDGLKATARVRCAPDDGPIKATVPAAGSPSAVTCRTSTTSADEEMYAELREETLQISPPPRKLSVRLATSSRTLPRRCEVTADGRPLIDMGSGNYQISTFGRVQLDATCDGTPATPKLVMVSQDAQIVMDWRANAPTLDLREHAPHAMELLVRGKTKRGAVWKMTLKRRPAGHFILPPLPAGTYLLGIGTDHDSLALTQPNESLSKRHVHLVNLGDHKDQEGNQIFVGVLETDISIDTGEIAVLKRDGAPL